MSCSQKYIPITKKIFESIKKTPQNSETLKIIDYSEYLKQHITNKPYKNGLVGLLKTLF